MTDAAEAAMESKDKAAKKATRAGESSLSKRFRALAEGATWSMDEMRDAAVRGAAVCAARAEENNDAKALLDALKLISAMAGLTKTSADDTVGMPAEKRAALTEAAIKQNEITP